MWNGNRGVVRGWGIRLPTCSAVWAVVFVCLALARLAGAASGLGQTAVDGAIGGRIVDRRGDSIVGAQILVRSAATGDAHTSVSGTDGTFLLARVIPGAYWLTISATGFKTELQQVTVELGAVANVEVQLKLEQVMTMLTVDAAPVPITGKPPLAEVVPPRPTELRAYGVTSSEQMEQMPVDGRRWQSFALLLPEANAGSAGGVGSESQAAVSFRGLAVTQNSTQIDGASGDQSFGSVAQGSGGGAGREAEEQDDTGSTTGAGGDGGRAQYGRHAGASYTFAQGAVQEFRIRSGTGIGAYSALDGHAVGGVVTTVSKSGTSAARGTAFYLARDSALAATNPFSLATNYVDGVVTSGYVKPQDLRQQFGATLGGPLRLPGPLSLGQRKLFYFATVDIQRRRNPAVSSPGYAQFYALTPTQQALLENRGVSHTATNTALNYLNSLTGTAIRREDQDIGFIKLDWNASAKDRLSAQVNRVRWDSPGGVRSAPVVERGLASLGNSYGKVDAGVARWVRLWTSHLSNEARLAYGRDFEYETAQQPLPQEPAIGPNGLAPQVAIGPNGFVFGTPASLGRKAYPDERRLQVAEIVEWVHGRHLLQAGFDFSTIADRIDALANQEGSFHFDSSATRGKAGGLVDWVTDYTFSANAYPNGACPSIEAKVHLFCFRTYSQSFGQAAVSFQTQEWAAFLQDEWRATATLRIGAGLRYEVEQEPAAQQPNAALDAVFGAAGTGRGGTTSVFPQDLNNFGPRLGLAWQPLGMGKGTVYLGYGVYYGRLPGATIRAALVDTALPVTSKVRSATHVRITPATVTECPQVANQGFGYGCAYLSEPPAAVGSTTSATVFDRRFRLPMIQQGSFGIEREIGHGVTARASFVMNLDRQLPNSVDINIAPSTAVRTFQLQGGPVGGSGPVGVTDGQTFVVPFYNARLSALYGPVTDIVSNANGTYNALVVEGSHRSRTGLEFRASWTWAKAIDYGQSIGATPRTNGQFDPFTIGYDKGLSTLNFPHKVTASAVWEPTLVTPRRLLRSAANGWQIDPLIQVVSGRPYSYEVFGGTRLPGGHTSINGSGGASYLPTVGRNTLRLPETVHADLRVARAFRLSERLRLRLSAEIFNLPNHVNYTSTITRAYLRGVAVNGVTPLVFQDAATVAAEGLNQQPFGTFTAASTANSRERQVQMGLRLEF